MCATFGDKCIDRLSDIMSDELSDELSRKIDGLVTKFMEKS